MPIKNFFPLVLDNTQLEAYNNCPIRFFRNHIQHFQSEESVDLIAGGAFAHGLHKAREAFYQHGAAMEDATSIGIEALREEYGNFHDPWKEAKSVDRMSLALESYLDTYDFRFDDVKPLKLADGSYSIEYSLLQEILDFDGKPILHPTLGLPLLYSGRLDMLAEYAGSIYMVDEKTTGSYFTKNWAQQWETRGQFTGYCWLGHNSNIPELQNLSGAIIRGISLPSSTAISDDTKAKFYSNIANVKHNFTLTNRSKYEVDCWHRDMVKRVLQMKKSYVAYLQNNEKNPEQFFGGSWGSACTSYGRGCQFIDTCKSAQGENFLEVAYNQNIWLPDQHKRVPLETYLKTLEGIMKYESSTLEKSV